MKDFVPLHLGFQHIDHQSAIEHHQTVTATILHTVKPDQLCIVADSTYLFIQKSMNNEFQRRSYSVHKHRNLVKPMILTTTVSLSSPVVNYERFRSQALCWYNQYNMYVFL
jgi:hypothetical protein